MSTYLFVNPDKKVSICTGSIWSLGFDYRSPSLDETLLYNKFMTEAFPQEENYIKLLDALKGSILENDAKRYIIYCKDVNKEHPVVELIWNAFYELISLRSTGVKFDLGMNSFEITNIPQEGDNVILLEDPVIQLEEGSVLKYAFLDAVVDHINS